MDAPPSAPRRALLVGVQKALDRRLPERPGTCAAVRRIGALLGAGEWDVRLLLDDEPADEHRPWRTNLLDGLGWLAGADEDALILLSGPVRDGWFCCRDARVDRLESTAVRLDEIAAELPVFAGVILDAPADHAVFDRVAWALGAGPAGQPEALAGLRGPTPFLDAVLRATAGEDRADLTVDSLAGFLSREIGGGPWKVGEGPSMALLTGLDGRKRTCGACGAPVPDSVATFCPRCGAPLEQVELLDGGRYRLTKRLGAGGMGQVFLAEDTRLKVRRALKLLSLPPGLRAADRETLRARMIQEARAAQALCAETHHVVQVYDVGFSPERGEPFLVMELLEGQTLTDRLVEGRMTVSDAVAIGRQIARALAIAHGRGFVHRDLKPDNIMLVERGDSASFVKLLDFGLVKAEQAEVSTETGRMMGTLQYMPPEQLRGMKVDARADVFSLGAVLYECLSGQRANPGSTQQEIFAVLLDRGVRTLGEVAPELPEPLVRLVDRCLQLIPDQRPADARAVAEALEAFDPSPFAYPPAMPPSAPPAAAPPVGTADTVVPRRGLSSMDRTAPTLAPSGHGVASNAPTTPTAAPSAVTARPGAPTTPTAMPSLEPAPPLRTTTTPGRPPALDTVPPTVVQAPPAGPRRWLLILPLLAVAAGIGLWVTTPPTEAPSPDAAVAVDAAQDAAPPDAAPPDAAIPDAGPTPLVPPAGPLPARPAASRTVDGSDVVYRGETAADLFAALVLDVTLALDTPPEPDVKAGERWQAAPDALRAWLAEGVPTDALMVETDGDDVLVRVPRATIDALRERRPRVDRLRGLGTLLTPPDGPPVLETVNCGRGSGGDRVLTATWKMKGYGTGTCEGGACGRDLARALQNARAADERLRVSLTLSRRSEDGDGPARRVSARCHVRP